MAITDVPPPPTLPVPTPGTTTNTSVVVVQTAAQVMSATLQNCVIAGCITYGWIHDKVSTEVTIPALLTLAGIDFIGRLKKLTGNPSHVAALGATGALSMLGKFHTILFVLVASLVTFGCATAGSVRDSALPVAGAALVAANGQYAKADEARAALCSPPEPGLEKVCESAALVLQRVYEALDAVVVGYQHVNEVAKELE